MKKFFLFILFLLAQLNYTQATEREYVISNLRRLINSYSTADFTTLTDETVDPIKHKCALQVNAFNQQQSNTLKALFAQLNQGMRSEDD